MFSAQSCWSAEGLPNSTRPSCSYKGQKDGRIRFKVCACRECVCVCVCVLGVGGQLTRTSVYPQW